MTAPNPKRQKAAWATLDDVFADAPNELLSGTGWLPAILR
jgi:hypothetical protein